MNKFCILYQYQCFGSWHCTVVLQKVSKLDEGDTGISIVFLAIAYIWSQNRKLKYKHIDGKSFDIWKKIIFYPELTSYHNNKLQIGQGYKHKKWNHIGPRGNHG